MKQSEPQQTIDPRLILLSERDNVCVVATDVDVGESLSFAGTSIVLLESMELGHKMAIRRIRKGEKVLKYGMPIGTATVDIEAGGHVHTHNLESDYLPTYSRTGKDSFLQVDR